MSPGVQAAKPHTREALNDGRGSSAEPRHVAIAAQSFTAELLNRFEKNPAGCKYFEVSNENKVPGTVEALQHPKWDTPKEIGKLIQERIQMAEQQSGVMREDLVRGGGVRFEVGARRSSRKRCLPTSQLGIGLTCG